MSIDMVMTMEMVMVITSVMKMLMGMTILSIKLSDRTPEYLTRGTYLSHRGIAIFTS